MPLGIKAKKAGPGQKEISGRSGKSRIFNTAEQDRKNKEMKKRTSSDKRTGPKEPVSKKAEGGRPGMFRRSAQAVKENKSGAYKIKSGDTLSQIAKSRGTTVKKLMEMNPSIKNANQIRAGANIKVPPKTEVSKMTGSKSSPYRGMSSKEITSGRMRKSPSKTSAESGAKKGAKSGGAKSTAKKPAPRVKSTADSPIAAKAGGMMKKMARGGKLPMVEKDGKKVPAFAADGKGKMARGGKVPAKMMRGGTAEKMMRGGKTKKMMRGGKTDKMMGGGTVRGAGAAVKGKKFTRSM